MASIKVLLYKNKKRTDGKTPITLRIIQNRKPSYLYLDWIEERHWNPKKSEVKNSYHSAARLNNLISNKIAEANDLILNYEVKKKVYTSSLITSMLKGQGPSHLFFTYASQYFDDLRQLKKFNRVISDEGRINKFKEFVGKKDISFEEIDQSLLNKFKIYLATKGNKVSERSIMNSLVVIRTIYNRAINEGLVEQQYYPFGKNKIQIKFPQTVKIGLTEEEIVQIEELDLDEKTAIWHTRNVFLFSFYLAGIRVSDVLRIKWSDLKNDRLYYQMGKNKKVDSLKLPIKVKAILEYYKEDKDANDDFIFPELKKASEKDPKDFYRKTKTATKKFNYYLKKIAELTEIEKKVTMHISRHSFGNIAGDKISPQMLQKLYRHSHLSTTIGYQGNFTHKNADDALENVLNF